MIGILQDIFLAFLIIVGIYAFLPAPIQATIRGMLHGALPVMAPLGGLARTGLRYAGQGLELLIVGKTRQKLTSTKPEPTPDPAPLHSPQPILQKPANMIAIQQNDYKTSFAIAPEVQSLAVLLEVDGDILEQQLITLARLCDADELGETAAIKVGLGISPSSTSAKYKAAKAALTACRRPARTEIVALTPDPNQPNREIAVRA